MVGMLLKLISFVYGNSSGFSKVSLGSFTSVFLLKVR